MLTNFCWQAGPQQEQKFKLATTNKDLSPLLYCDHRYTQYDSCFMNSSSKLLSTEDLFPLGCYDHS
jgi:hypothetical protein